MYLTVLVIIIILLSFITQIVYWRILKPTNTAKSLITVLILSNCLYYVLITQFFIFHENEINLIYKLKIILTLISFDFSYIFLFPGIELQSPTLDLINNIINSKKGLDLNKFIIKKKNIDKNHLILRITQLQNEKYISKNKGKYFLTNKGRLLSQIFLKYKKILKTDYVG